MVKELNHLITYNTMKRIIKRYTSRTQNDRKKKKKKTFKRKPIEYCIVDRMEVHTPSVERNTHLV